MNDAAQPLPLGQCPIPSPGDQRTISLAHGEGGRLSRQLIRDQIVSRLGNSLLNSMGDATVLPVPGASNAECMAFTTDGYTVTPLFFPGGDIGSLAVNGTVNDLAVSGAIPRWLSLSMILEEGLPLDLFSKVLDSIRVAADIANVKIVTGDTKVVPRGTADGMYLTTSGIGEFASPPPAGPPSIQSGDVIIASGPMGCHGAAILCARESFDFDPPPRSDCAPLTEPIRALLNQGLTPRAMRDATRGGVAAVLHEWTEASHTSITIQEDQLPLTASVRAVCELLGLDPLHLANEGMFLIATPPNQVESTLDCLQKFDTTRAAAVIGEVRASRRVPVSVVRVTGREVPVEDPAGSPLPRIC